MNTICLVLIAMTLGQVSERVGTFHQPSIVVAYYRSDLWAKVLRDKTEALKAAKAAGDEAKAAELQKWGRESQDLAHRQLAGKAPIDNVLEALRPVFSQVAAKAGVREVSVKPRQDAETVDITDLLLDALKADERTRKIVEELRNSPK